jgi:hypothetical protein
VDPKIKEHRGRIGLMAASGSAKNQPVKLEPFPKARRLHPLGKPAMRHLRSGIHSVIVIGLLAVGLLAAQAQMQPIPPAPSNSEVAAAAVKDASTWTRAKWNGMKAKWSLDKAKWAGCRAQAKAQKLAGRRSWRVIANCMTH